MIFGRLTINMVLAMSVRIALFDSLDMVVSFFDGGHLHVRR